jgi:hypothetical protein
MMPTSITLEFVSYYVGMEVIMELCYFVIRTMRLCYFVASIMALCYFVTLSIMGPLPVNDKKKCSSIVFHILQKIS